MSCQRKAVRVDRSLKLQQCSVLSLPANVVKNSNPWHIVRRNGSNAQAACTHIAEDAIPPRQEKKPMTCQGYLEKLPF
jgi:hypothetical protein